MLDTEHLRGGRSRPLCGTESEAEIRRAAGASSEKRGFLFVLFWVPGRRTRLCKDSKNTQGVFRTDGEPECCSTAGKGERDEKGRA